MKFALGPGRPMMDSWRFADSVAKTKFAMITAAAVAAQAVAAAHLVVAVQAAAVAHLVVAVQAVAVAAQAAVAAITAAHPEAEVPKTRTVRPDQARVTRRSHRRPRPVAKLERTMTTIASTHANSLYDQIEFDPSAFGRLSRSIARATRRELSSTRRAVADLQRSD